MYSVKSCVVVFAQMYEYLHVLFIVKHVHVHEYVLFIVTHVHVHVLVHCIGILLWEGNKAGFEVILRVYVPHSRV